MLGGVDCGQEVESHRKVMEEQLEARERRVQELEEQCRVRLSEATKRLAAVAEAEQVRCSLDCVVVCVAAVGCADGHCHISLSQSLASSVAEDASRRAVATQSADTRERAVREREARVSEMVAEAEARMASLSRREAAVVAREEVRWMMANLQCCVWLQHVSTCVVVLD
jgi:hypothetical protein